MVEDGLPPSSRLRDGDDGVGLLLRSAGQALTGQVTPPFSDLLVAQRRRHAARWGALALAAVAMLAVGVSVLEHSSQPDIRAEFIAKTLPEGRVAADTQSATSPPAALPGQPGASSALAPRDRPAPPVAHSPPKVSVPPPVLASPAVAPARGDCPVLLRSGRYAEARSCFDELSRGSGVDAEMALLEKARLEMRAFKDRAAARLTLQSYRTRFPAGILMTEAVALESEVKRLANDQPRALAPGP